MVFIARTLLADLPKKPPRAYLKTRFVDSVRLYLKGGSGGTGLPKYGGIGGQGGCVYCVGKPGVDLRKVLHEFPKKQVVAGHGEDSSKYRIVGAPGKDIKIDVPIGVRVYREDGKLLADINQENQTCIAARGGPGGTKESGFLGHTGQNHFVRLDLRLIADIGLVGFPNAGKSSLLKAISRAKPRIASYPFTTLKPNIGTLVFPDLRQITMADLPGLIEGAHTNVGLGHQFLKHVERTKLLLLVADIEGFQLSVKHSIRSCLETVILLNKELELYNKELLDKPAILAINKLDLPGAKEKFKEIKSAVLNMENILHTMPEDIRPERVIKFEDIVGISALGTDESVTNLKDLLRERLDHYADENNPEVKDVTDVLRRSKAMMRERGPQIT